MKKKAKQNIDFRFDKIDKESAHALAFEILKKMKTGMTLQDATGVNDSTLEEIYSLAYSYYNLGKYKESVALFEFLAGAAPKTYKFLFGLGSSYHQLEVYEEAAMAFYTAFLIEPENPTPVYYMADTFLRQNQFEAAEECLNVTIDLSADRPEFQDLKKRCELILQSLKVKK